MFSISCGVKGRTFRWRNFLVSKPDHSGTIGSINKRRYKRQKTHTLSSADQKCESRVRNSVLSDDVLISKIRVVYVRIR